MAAGDQPTLPNTRCLHPQTVHWHGTYACYGLDKCRCTPCQDARTRYERHRVLVGMGRRPSNLTDAEPARTHVHQLINQGMGLKRIAQVSGVPHGALWKLIYGKHGNPSARITITNHQRLMATVLDVADGANVPRRETDLIVAELAARGWTRAAIARHVHGPAAVALQLDGHQVMAGTLRALRQLLERPVPARTSSRGTTWTPDTGHQWKDIRPTTPGVPPSQHDPLVAARQLTCAVCSRPLADHAIADRCAA